jgi:hypothetical protein
LWSGAPRDAQSCAGRYDTRGDSSRACGTARQGRSRAGACAPPRCPGRPPSCQEPPRPTSIVRTTFRPTPQDQSRCPGRQNPQRQPHRVGSRLRPRHRRSGGAERSGRGKRRRGQRGVPVVVGRNGRCCGGERRLLRSSHHRSRHSTLGCPLPLPPLLLFRCCCCHRLQAARTRRRPRPSAARSPVSRVGDDIGRQDADGPRTKAH